jgi:VanZ family protein
MPQKFITIAAWALLAFITYSTVSPIQARPMSPLPASIEHFAAFAALGMLFCLAYPKHRCLASALVIGSAVLLEIAQLLIPDRDARLADALQKLAAGAFGIGVVTVMRRLAFIGRWDRTK